MRKQKKTTINDIAAYCKVSKALVGAVLSGVEYNIGCSATTKERILQAAKKLNYRPNRLARAMKTGIAPLVAVCVYYKKAAEDEINVYLHDLLPTITTKFQKLGFNTIFVPYDDVESMLEQTENLANDNLISGIVTNFPIGHLKKIIVNMKSIGLPYVILGNVKDKTVPSVHIDNSLMNEKLCRYAAHKGFKQVVFILAKKDKTEKLTWELSLIDVNSPSGGAHKIQSEDVNPQDEFILWAVLGEFTRKNLVNYKKINLGNSILIEGKRILIQSTPALLVKEKAQDRAELVASLLHTWIKEKKCPRDRKKIIKLSENDIEFIDYLF